MCWFLAYLMAKPAAIRHGLAPRPQIITWQDAAGASRWVAAVVRCNAGYLRTRIQIPQHIWAQLAPRNDSRIGYHELLGVVLRAIARHF